jgi:ribosomal protein L10
VALNFAQKEAIVAEVAEVAKGAYSVIGAEYRGLTVEQMTRLRVEARKSGSTSGSSRTPWLDARFRIRISNA